MNTIGTAISVARTLSDALQCKDLVDMLFHGDFKFQLEDFQRTVNAITAVLRDAQRKEKLSQQTQHQIEQLKDAIFQADDLLDEFVTLARQQRLIDAQGSLLERISHFFSLSNPICVSYWMCRGIKDIKKKLDAITCNNQYNLDFDPEPIKKRSRDTSSHVHAVDIIGREEEIEQIVDLMLQSNAQRDVTFLSIVGIGGLGKTALAQLLYNDQRVKSAFSLRAWTCVSDQDQEQLDIKGILSKILESATKTRHDDASLELVQTQLREKLEGRKFLLVLDDVWTEDRDQWHKLEEFLTGCQKGSWVVVTTRSRETARIIGDGLMHLLQGLSKKDSWRLFERRAFGSENSNPPQDLVYIGQKVVEQCANVPLAIRVSGSLLYGQDISKWLAFQELGLTKIGGNKNGILPILKLSYHQLESPIRSCFGYCALFPKDYVMKKKTLMRLWMAQGYIPVDDEERIEYVAEEYFSILLQRCFFQDVEEDESGDIYSCKIHDLMHDVAREVAGNELCTVNSTIFGNVNKEARHFCIKSRRGLTNYCFTETRARSYFHVSMEYGASNMDQLSLDTLLANWKYLRVLHLNKLETNRLPVSICELLHLRYIDLSRSRNLEILPRKITNLYNLQTLKLRFCERLKELPKDISKLVKLRVLDICGCLGLSYMPRGMGNMSCLQDLPMFVVGEENSSWDNFLNGLQDLKALKSLKGSLEIKIGFCKKDAKTKRDGGKEGGILRNKRHLNSLKLHFQEGKGERRVEIDEAVIEELQPNSNLKRLDLLHYQGLRMPVWARECNLAHLVWLDLYMCLNLQSLGCLGNLYQLKRLNLLSLKNLGYLLEDYSTRIIRNMRASYAMKEFLFFPSLEQIYFRDLPKLKGWWRGVGDDYQLLWLPQLKKFQMLYCPNMTAILECPVLEVLQLANFNERLGITLTRKLEEKENGDVKGKLGETTTSSLSPLPSCCDHPVLKLRAVDIDNLKWLNTLHLETFQCLESLDITDDQEIETLGEGHKVFNCCSSSLRSFHIRSCLNLNLPGGLEYLTALEVLKISDCPNLQLSEEGEMVGGSGMPWQSLSHSLRTLILGSLPQMVSLPNWLLYLTTLQTLKISYCNELESLPNWMPKLTSLKELRLNNCSAHLKRRCQRLIGEDWPHIQHISSVTIRDWC